MKGIITPAIMLLLLASSLEGQICRPGAGSNEAKTLALLSVPIAFGPASAPATNRGFELGVEGTYLPKVDAATATATICRPGKGPEHTDFLFALPRPRISVPLPGRLALQASWIPPIRLAGVKANLFAFSLARVFARRDGLVAAIRTHAAVGSIRAPITCDQGSLADPVSECFRGTLSDDKYSPNVYGADVSVGLAGGTFRPYVGGGYNRLQPRFQVNFRNQFGSVDRTRVEVDLNRAVMFAGASWQFRDRLAATGEVYAAPADAVTARLVLRAALGP